MTTFQTDHDSITITPWLKQEIEKFFQDNSDWEDYLWEIEKYYPDHSADDIMDTAISNLFVARNNLLRKALLIKQTRRKILDLDYLDSAKGINYSTLTPILQSINDNWLGTLNAFTCATYHRILAFAIVANALEKISKIFWKQKLKEENVFLELRYSNQCKDWYFVNEFQEVVYLEDEHLTEIPPFNQGQALIDELHPNIITRLCAIKDSKQGLLELLREEDTEYWNVLHIKDVPIGEPDYPRVIESQWSFNSYAEAFTFILEVALNGY